MPIDFSTVQPVQGSGLTPRKGSRTAGPNPFLDEGWLYRSYETGEDEEITVPGKYVTVIRERGEHAGEEIQKLTGDAADVVAMLRSASNKLGIGVIVQVVPAKRGYMTVKYLGKERKQHRGSAVANELDEETSE